VIRLLSLTLVLFLIGCSNKLGRVIDLEDHEGNYIDIFVLDDLSSDVRSEFEDKVSSNFSGTITYEIERIQHDVLEWKGEEIKTFTPDQKGTFRIETKRYKNGFLAKNVFELAYLGYVQLDVQAYQPGYKYFWPNHFLGDIEFKESNPEVGLQYDYWFGPRSSIHGGHTKRSVVCEPEGEHYPASDLHEDIPGDALDFICSLRQENGVLIGDDLVSYLFDSKTFVLKTERTVSGTSHYKIKSFET